MKKTTNKFLFILFLLLTVFFQFSIFNFQFTKVYADELEEISRQIAELENLKKQSESASKPLEIELERLELKISQIQNNLNQAEEKIKTLERNIEKREKDFSQQYFFLAQHVENYYKSLFTPPQLTFILSSRSASSLAKNLFYRQMLADEDKKIISQISLELLDLEKDKKKVEEDKVRLAELHAKTDQQAQFFRKEVKSAKTYQKELTAKIAQLTARQKEIIAQKLGSLNLPTSLGAGPLYCVDDRNINPGFSPAFAFFTYGIPHRVGMNQYGAYGRALAGQNHEEILRAYFNNISFEIRNTDLVIKVQGYGSYPLEEYVKRIYEVPDSWPIEALKAQAIAARSYALAYTNNGAGEICPTQACQVFKPEAKGGNWDKAVEETKGKVMVNSGKVIKAWYSSTDGGYTFTSAEVWGSATDFTKNLKDSSSSVNSFSDLQKFAYDKDSPCFYSAQGWRKEYGKSAWLKPEEVADIANVIMLARFADVDKKHLYQTDKPNPEGVETWDENRVKKELQLRGGKAIERATEVNISAVNWEKGRTLEISINGFVFNADEFKNWFNLRAPANIQIVGPLYNVERR